MLSPMHVGAVSQVWRYPVKSMVGERVARASLDDRGLVGDRGWAARDEERGGIRGAKKIGPLMRLQARYLDEPTATNRAPNVEITLPDGAGTVTTDDPSVHRVVSDALEHRVTLWPLQPTSDTEHYRRGPADSDDIVEELRDLFGRTETEPLPDLSVFPPEIVEFESPPGTYYDAFPIHVVTTASLRTLARLSPGSEIDVRRFRPNVLVETDGDGFPEADWLGKRLTVGGGVELEVVAPCPRCVMVTRQIGDDLGQDRRLLRTIVREADQNVGVYATVVRGGPVAEGDAVALA
jgi:uncharacterized protein YcbX